RRRGVDARRGGHPWRTALRVHRPGHGRHARHLRHLCRCLRARPVRGGGTVTATETTTIAIPDVTDLDTHGAALAYAKSGIYVVPTRAGTKNPGSRVGNAWQSKGTRDQLTI